MMLIILLTKIIIQETIDKLVEHLRNQNHQITIVMANHGTTGIDHIIILVALEAVEEDPQIEIKVMMMKKMGPPTLEALEEVVEVPPDDPGNGGYDDQESEDSEGFPHYPYWPPYGRYYCAKPPHPDAKINAAEFYGMPYYHYYSGWPRPQEYHYTRQLPGGEDKWVWQEQNGKSQQDLNKESKLNLKLPSSFSGMDRRKWKPFLTECLVHFQAKPITYKEDSSKIAFAAALLEGPALTHYTTTLQQNSKDLFFHNWANFIERMGSMFGLINQ
jgi:hypothetical protein